MLLGVDKNKTLMLGLTDGGQPKSLWLHLANGYMLIYTVCEGFEPPDSIIGPIFDPPSKHVDREVH